MTADAEEYFYGWYNGIIESVNAIENDAEVESRKMKLNGHAARLALLFQIMKWAVGEADMQYVELSSVKAAIRMLDYYEETYRRIQEIIVSDSIGETREAWLSLLGDTFQLVMPLLQAKRLKCPDGLSIMHWNSCADFRIPL